MIFYLLLHGYKENSIGMLLFSDNDSFHEFLKSFALKLVITIIPLFKRSLIGIASQVRIYDEIWNERE